MAELTATIKVRGDLKEGFDPHTLGELLNDAINRDARFFRAAGFSVFGVESSVPDAAQLDPRTGIEEQRRLCDHCGRFLGYTHSPECDRAGQVEMTDTLAN